MKERFEGDNAAQLKLTLYGQPLIGNDKKLAEAIISSGVLMEFPIGEDLIEQEAADNDVFFLIAGEVAILVNGAHVATRRAGEMVGEMATIEPSLPRSATVRALETVLALKVPSAAFLLIADAYPQIWRPLAQGIAKQLYRRNATIRKPNGSPNLFIISSSEALPVANALRAGLEQDVFSTVWDQGVFWAGGYPLEALERQVADSDFAVGIAEPDDILETRGERTPTLRDNVLFEVGLFMGKLTRHRSILIFPKIERLKLPSDLQGLTLISYEAGDAPIAERIRPACDCVREVVKRLGVKVFGRP